MILQTKDVWKKSSLCTLSSRKEEDNLSSHVDKIKEKGILGIKNNSVLLLLLLRVINENVERD